jgi:hypothetical protein
MNKLLSVAFVFVLLVLTPGCGAHPRQDSQSVPPLFKPAPGFPLALGGRPNEIAVGDWNKDGRLDVAICKEGDGVAVLLGNGRGNFTPAPNSPIRVEAHIIAAGDVNNDKIPDIALTHHDSFGIVILLGAGDGTFAPAPGSPFTAHQGAKAHNHGLALNDLNADGNLDITTSNQDDNSVSVLLGNGRGGFAPVTGSPFAVGRAPYPHAVGDVNGDSNLDIITPNVGSNNLTVLLGNGRGNFAPAPNSPYSVATRPYYVVVGDVSGDGKPDLISSHDDINLLTTLLGDGRGRFSAAPDSPLDLGSRAFKLVTADVNRDARVDLVIGTEGSDSVVVLLSGAGGAYTPAAGSPYRAGRSPKVAIGDVNGDGKPDIITANNGSDDLMVLLRE